MTGGEARTTLLRAARAVDVSGIVEDPWLLLDGDTIRATGSGPDAPAAEEVVDLGTATITPGFVDLHGHGGGGGAYDHPDQIPTGLAVHRAHGTTRSVISLVANPVPVLVDHLTAIRALAARDPLVLGAHLEGPFLSPDNRGAHHPAYLVPPEPDAVAALLTAGEGVLRQITIAPELPGAERAIPAVVEAGVVAAVGHTTADHGTAQRAFDLGASMLTHAFNAMPGIHHRAPGPISAAIADDRVTLELILDGVHVAPAVARILLRAAPGRVALITDAMAAAGSPDGDYMLGDLGVRVTDGVAHVAGSDTIAGSTLTQDAALRIALTQTDVSLVDAVAALTAVPAGAIGEGERLGRLAPGYAADVVAFRGDWTVAGVWAAGVPVAGASAD
ncbi:N-acetylglucosamine-6-phosphate deacetylase [Curtobacterium sp. MCBD17_028]|uniref:N-acetylglucosamine-6-phosphate deacetylase n=1 Tax=Curtobacterium sp. MCBD17_028 TaxID=2175670 RepID=UPI000DA9CEE8|nr:amidohydrolase family protein [Curtobacterium sp. MCBD17_028]PZE27215.1 N-acetylglucosamine-6-phosphate deacetylase [Curtobacterium sp. MCBD17_028]